MPLPKPPGCIGCPFAQHGATFTPDTIVPNSKVYFLAQNPGPDEEHGHKLKNRYWQSGQSYDEWDEVVPQPLIGATGQLFNNRFLPLSGLQRNEVSLGNAIRCRPGASLGLKADALPNISTPMRLESSKADIVGALRHCRDAHMHIPPSVDTIVTMGRYAMFSLTGIQNEESEYGRKQGVMESWRGYGVDVSNLHSFATVDTSYYHPLTNTHRILFTMHIAALFQGANKAFYHATLEDFNKLRLLREGKWPLPMPTWLDTVPEQWPSYSCFDTEYIPEENALIRWSLCDTTYQTWCIEAEDTPPEGIPIAPGSIVLTQNALADISHLATITDMSKVRIEDMMLAHSVLWTGERHGMNYIASKYGPLNRHKHLSNSNPQMYSAMDAYVPMYMWLSYFLPTFKADLASWKVYQKYRLSQINIIDQAQQAGQSLDGERLLVVQQVLQERIKGYIQQAREITGNQRFNLGGRKDMQEVIYG